VATFTYMGRRRESLAGFTFTFMGERREILPGFRVLGNNLALKLTNNVWRPKRAPYCGCKSYFLSHNFTTHN
jgi:hypothetical protein